MRREGRLVLAAQAERHKRCEPADDEPVGIDHHPLLLDFGGFGRKGLHVRIRCPHPLLATGVVRRRWQCGYLSADYRRVNHFCSLFWDISQMVVQEV